MHLPQPFARRLKFVFFAATCFAVISTCATYYVHSHGHDCFLDYVDIPLHLLGGFIAASAFVIAIHHFYRTPELKSLPKLFAMLSILGFVALVAIAWEILEYFADRYLGTMVQLTIADTLKDIIVGLIGAAPVALSWPRPSHWEK